MGPQSVMTLNQLVMSREDVEMETMKIKNHWKQSFEEQE